MSDISLALFTELERRMLQRSVLRNLELDLFKIVLSKRVFFNGLLLHPVCILETKLCFHLCPKVGLF